MVSLALVAPAPANEVADLDAIYRIKQQGLQNSQVMDLVSTLTDVHGPRLTGSPNYMAAAQWAADMFTEWGLENARVEPWGEFGRGWSLERFSAHVVAPQSFPLIGFPKAWTPGTGGKVAGEVISAVIQSEEEMEALRGTLGGKFVLVQEMPELEPRWEAQASRWTAEELAGMELAPEPRAGGGRMDFSRYRAMRELRTKIGAFLVDEGVLAVLEPGGRGHSGTGGTLFVSSGGSQDVDAAPVPPQIVLTTDHYGRLQRLVDRGETVKIEVEIAATFHEDDLQGYNVLAELPGTDLADEIVMLGAHLDSWHAGTGATDNAAGTAAMMEAIRIIKDSGLQPRRTIRVGLWGGEEQGLLGSRGWVKNNLADAATMELLAEHEKVSAYYNMDNGTGAIRGVYMQGNEGVGPIFAAWMEPFRSLGMTTLTIRDTGGTDHLAFDSVGVPGFQFIQDPVEYRTRTHHSNFDTYERIVPGDMMKNATIIAAFAYHTAMRDEPLPRKPLPEPSRMPF
jgi:hypothetical protein